MLLQSINQSIDQSINQSTNQSINQYSFNGKYFQLTQPQLE